jgi:hypothetical protein
MNPVTRRWWLLAIAGAPIVMGVTALALSVRVDNDFLRVGAPNLQFLTGEPLRRLHDGSTVGFLGQLSILTSENGPATFKSAARFDVSHDVLELMTTGFKVVLATPEGPSVRNLSPEAAQSWCLSQLKIDLTDVPPNRPIWVRLEIRSQGPKETDGIVGAPGISLTGLIELLNHRPPKQEVHLTARVGPYTISDLRKGHL